jgi:hypothetical protein
MLLTIGTGAGTLVLRALGADALGDIAAVAYLLVATVTFGRPLSLSLAPASRAALRARQ